jgi:hypothetical protein
MANFHYESMFGDMPLLIAEISTDDGRDIAVQSPARGSRHYLQDRGAKLGKAECEILFISEPGKASYLERFAQFRALVAGGEPKIFSHPLIGTYRARAEGGRHSANSESKQIRFQCSFLPEDEPQPATPTGSGVAPIAGVETITVAVDAVKDQLLAQDPPQTWLDDLVSFVTSAANTVDIDSQEVISGAQVFTGIINDTIKEFDLATDIARWPLYQALINLFAAVQVTVESLTSDDDQTISVRVDRPMPLLSICSEIYGPDLAADQAQRVTRMNRLRTPNRVPAGTTLTMPSPRSA